VDTQIWQYVPVLFLIVGAVIVVAGMLIGSALIGRKGNRSPVKDSAYECGMIPVHEGVPKFSVKFYLVAMLFILFDVEVVFLYPWAVIYRESLRDHAGVALLSILSFLGVLGIGYLYALKKGAFDWRQ
jgi:NADH-quinone oxidoreductase subunit A